MASKKHDPITVAEWQRNARERIRISLDQFCGRNVVSLRTWWTNEKGEERPGRDGITLDIHHVSKLAKAFKRAERRAKKKGLIKEG
jgi:Transcriptional Coactivator p15 (PC4)